MRLMSIAPSAVLGVILAASVGCPSCGEPGDWKATPRTATDHPGMAKNKWSSATTATEARLSNGGKISVHGGKVVYPVNPDSGYKAILSMRVVTPTDLNWLRKEITLPFAPSANCGVLIDGRKITRATWDTKGGFFLVSHPDFESKRDPLPLLKSEGWREFVNGKME